MDKLDIVLTNFEPIFKTHPIPQQEAIDYTAWLLAIAQCSKNNIESSEEAEKIYDKMKAELNRYGVSPSHVAQRELNIFADIFCHQKKAFSTEKFPLTFENIIEDYKGKDLYNRLMLYEKLVYDLTYRWYENTTELPDDIIHATCTGYLSPSPIQKFVSNKNWGDITVTNSYQMGCYGAKPPLRMAVGFLASSYTTLALPKKRIDVLHTEYSSLHIQAVNYLPDQIVSMTLFGDGFIKYSACANLSTKTGLRVLAIQDKIIPNTLDEMTLIPGPYSFDMWLSKNVPLKIKEQIYAFVTSMCNQIQLDFETIKDKVIFALHPGGPKILDHIQERLNIKDAQIRFSRQILKKHGNMVSATLPYIWKEIIEDPEISAGTKVISIAFGPGITIAGSILEKV